MSSTELVAIGLLVLSGFLVGGVVSFWTRSKPIAVVLALLALLAVGAAVLRLVPTGV